MFIDGAVTWSFDNEQKVLMGRWLINDYRAYPRHVMTSNPSMFLESSKVKWHLRLHTIGDGVAWRKFASLFLECTPKKTMKFYCRLGWEDKNGSEVWKKEVRVKSSDDEREVIGDAAFLKLEEVDNVVKENGSVTFLVALCFRRRDSLGKDLGMLLDGKLTDIEIRVTKGDGGVIKAHRAILAARSPMFCGMFDSDTIEKTTGVITVDAYDFAVVRKLLEYLYTSQIEFVGVAFAAALRIAADYYQVPDLVEDCESYILENVDKTSVIPALLSTVELDSESIKEACLAEIKLVNDVDEIDQIQELFANPELSKLVFNYLLP